MQNEQVKYQTVEVTWPAGTSGVVDTPVQLDPAFAYCDGIVAYEKTDGGIGSYDIGLSEDNRVHHDLVDKRDFQPGEGVPLNERYKDLHIENRKQFLYVKTKLSQPAASELRFQFVFRLKGKS